MLTKLKLIFAFMLLLSAPVHAQEVPQSSEQLQLSYAPLVKKAAPAVVNIYSTKKVRIKNIHPMFSDPFFKRFFGGNMMFGRKREKVTSSLGSGVIVRPDGLIISNHHVIGDGREIKVVLNDAREFAAEVVLRDERSDLAILKLIDPPEDEPLPYLEFADSDELDVGDLVLAIGNPFGVGQTVTSGIVSALARTNVDISDFQFFIQTDAAINPGNSGGALVNMDGKVVGINTAIFSKSGGSLGIGFATPSNMAVAVINSATEGGRIVRPWLGVVSQKVTQDIADSLGMKRPVGVLVNEVYPKSAADLGGVKSGDVILSIGGKEISDNRALRFRIATYAIGDEVSFGILREGEEQIRMLTMMRAVEFPLRNQVKLEGQTPLSGLEIANLSPALAEEIGMKVNTGVVVLGVWRRSPAAELNFGRGDIITNLNGQNIISVKQLQQILESDDVNIWQITIKRGNTEMRVIVR